MRNIRLSEYLPKLLCLIVLFVPCNLLALTQDDGTEPCCYTSPQDQTFGAEGQSETLIAQDDGTEPCCYNAPYKPALDVDRPSEILLVQDDGTEPCCYNAPYDPVLDIQGRTETQLAQDDGTEPCCYRALEEPFLHAGDQIPLLLSAGELRQTKLPGLPHVATAIRAAAFPGKEECELLVTV